MSNAVSWNLQVAIREGHLDDFRALMEEMVAATRQEEGMRAYEWYISDDGRACHLYERYADSAATMVHIGNFGANFAERFMTCVEPTAFHVYGAPSAEVRGALDGFGAQYLGWFGGEEVRG